eukprot:366344-Chlamydomonas_euryale.AAC.1
MLELFNDEGLGIRDAQRALNDAVAGQLRSDRQMLRMNELEVLFAPPVFGAASAQAAAPAAAAAADPAAAEEEVGEASGAEAAADTTADASDGAAAMEVDPVAA